jgi:hypothetical protein
MLLMVGDINQGLCEERQSMLARMGAGDRCAGVPGVGICGSKGESTTLAEAELKLMLHG